MPLAPQLSVVATRGTGSVPALPPGRESALLVEIDPKRLPALLGSDDEQVPGDRRFADASFRTRKKNNTLAIHSFPHVVPYHTRNITRCAHGRKHFTR